MNNTAKFARLVAVSVSAVWAAALFYSGVDLDGHARRVLAYLPSAIGFLVVAFDLWLWKIPGVAHIAGRPRVYGTWKATLRPSSGSQIPPGGNRGPIIGAMVIEQTFWTTSVRFHTDQSSSKSSTSAIAPDTDSRQSKSFYFTYSNQAKSQILGVNESTLATHGAVSAECAEEMAKGVLRLGQADIGLSVTGIAGPDGGTPEKPVGLVYLGLAFEDSYTARTLHLGAKSSRSEIRFRTANEALNMVRLFLLGL